MVKISTRPVKHRHEVVADGMYALRREIAETLLVVLDELVPVRATVFYAFAYRKTLHDRPPHAETFDIFTKVPDLLTGPYLTVRHIVEGGDYAFHTNFS